MGVKQRLTLPAALTCPRNPLAPARVCHLSTEEVQMLKLALFFLIVAIIAGLFGFTGIAAAAAGIAKILFFIFVLLFVLLLIAGLMVGSALF
jgi:uncharacterized membrane protein YtjA (UPF0391 family)